jgi:hypothetical protein
MDENRECPNGSRNAGRDSRRDKPGETGTLPG